MTIEQIRSSKASPNYTNRFLALAILFLAPLVMLGCPSNGNKPVVQPTTEPPKTTSDFDGERAFEHVRKQVEFGPRPAGSAELEKTRNYLSDELKSYGLKVTSD
jgi:hypothetical protein